MLANSLNRVGEGRPSADHKIQERADRLAIWDTMKSLLFFGRRLWKRSTRPESIA